jgi:hypothetical protein
MMPDLQLLNAAGPTKAFASVPVVHPAVVTLVHDGSAESAAHAETLQKRIEEIVISIHESVNVTAASCAHDLDGSSTCATCSDPDTRKLLVLVAAHSLADCAAFDWWLSGGSERRILPVMPAGSHPETLLPPRLRHVNAFFWNHSPGEAAGAVLAAAGLTPESRRLFISYRRLETEPLAEHLFEAFNRAGFSVFLDRFVVPPGVDFQRRLDQELGDKAMVLVLESEKLSSSSWTAHEIEYCVRYRLGCFALHMPHGMGGAPVERLPSISDGLRYALAASDFEKPPVTVHPSLGDPFLQWGRLNGDVLDKEVQEIRKQHDLALLRRRHAIVTSMGLALDGAGATSRSLRADGLLTVKAKTGRGYALWLTTRPPELPDFHSAHTAAVPVACRGVVVGPIALLEPDTRRRLDWLSGVCEFVCKDEGDLLKVAEGIARGDL